jgi:hypothetical protein
MPIDMPAAPGFVACEFGLETNTQRFESPLTKAIQRVLLGGARWVATYTLPMMNRAQTANWQAFLLSLEGGVNTFNAFDPDARAPRGNITGSTPLVMGGSQTGSSLNIDGLAASTNNILLPGDYFVVNGEMKMVTSPLSSNGSGQGTANFKPALRNSPADNAPLTITNCTVPMILPDDNQSRWRSGTRLGIYEGLTFSAMEVFS